MDPAGIPSGDDAKTDGDIVFYSRDGGKVTVSKERWRESLPEYFEEVSGSRMRSISLSFSPCRTASVPSALGL